jgi:outer membrane protein
MLKRYSLILTLLLLNGSAEAQTVFRSLEEVWKYADIHNITIRTAKYEAEKAGYAKKQAYGALLPQASANGSFTDNTQLQTTVIPLHALNPLYPADSFQTVQFGRQFVYTGGIAAQLSILNLQNWYNTRIAKQTEELNKASLANSRKAIYQQVATQYYSYLLMQEAARLANESSLLADSVYQSVNNKYKEGSVNEANVDVAKLNFERAQQNFITANYQMLIAKNNMKALLNFSVSDSLAIDATLENNFNLDNTGIFQEDPAIKLALYQQKISLSQYKASNSAFAPTVNLVYNYLTQRFDDTFEPFSMAKGITAWFPSQYWALQAAIPIFTGGTRFYQSKKNKVAYIESKDQYENAKKQSAINDENVKLNYQRAAAVLVKTKNVMNLSFDNYTHVSYRYEGGIESIESRLNAFKDYIDYQNQYLNSLSDMLVQLYQIKIRQQSF